MGVKGYGMSLDGPGQHWDENRRMCGIAVQQHAPVMFGPVLSSKVMHAHPDIHLSARTHTGTQCSVCVYSMLCSLAFFPGTLSLCTHAYTHTCVWLTRTPSTTTPRALNTDTCTHVCMHNCTSCMDTKDTFKVSHEAPSVTSTQFHTHTRARARVGGSQGPLQLRPRAG